MRHCAVRSPAVAAMCLALGACEAPERGMNSADSSPPSNRADELGKTAIPVSPKDGPLPLKVSWWGQACVSIETFWGLTIVIDPHPGQERIGFPPLDLTADLVLVTHNHPDHAAVDAVGGDPKVLRGLTDDGDWFKIDHYLDRPPNQFEPALMTQTEAQNLSSHAVHVRGVGVHHDAQGGNQRGRNTAFVIEVAGVRIAHCGDLGHVLTDEQVATIGPIDLLLVPVGGKFTVDAAAALEVTQQLRPRRWVWPIHYHAGVGQLPLAPRDDFVTAAEQAGFPARQVKGNAIAITRSATEGSSPGVILSAYAPVALRSDVSEALAAMRGDRRALVDDLGKVTKTQLDHKPSNGTHTIRWNFEHTTGRELGFFSQVYHALDDEIPVINWNPPQMPPDYAAREPTWGTAEMVRHVRRVAAFTERFSYLLADTPADMRIEGTRFSVSSLSKLMVGHYHNHTTKAVLKFDLPDWPKP